MTAKKTKKKTGAIVPENKANRSHFPFLRLAVFVCLVLIANAFVWVSAKAIMPYREFMAWLAGLLISFSGLDVVQKGVYLIFANEQWKMSTECTALTAMIVFVAFIVVYPSSIKSKAIAILAGLPFMFFANIVRLFTLAWATELCAKYAHWIHDYVWQVTFLFLIAVMWLVWIDKVVNRENKAAVSV